MESKILKVVKCGEMITVTTTNRDGAQVEMNKRQLVLQELGGKYENHYVVMALGNQASLKPAEGDIVVAALRFGVHEYEGKVFQDITVTDIYPL